ncbi:MgtC/SapB family protein [Paradesertivirga mongoliensis]|uniref:MgtC/SapB family protein n=1 Tax=Paradesertivirga mongoliensis TaxID=2100740 RepID=A0ABW4ZQY9_9SPHI|nr:MgtC/SapB family protein [Pedobacter mongoliensis]
MFDSDFNHIDLIKIAVSVMCGSVIGFEREYKNKSAGLRTMILICLGATVFTMVSQKAGEMSDDRIAANIITGIGFIGAGVIFKDGLSISGLTTASVIWVTASLGMAIGIGHFTMSLILTGLIILVLSLFSWLEMLMDFFYTRKVFNITFKDDCITSLVDLEALIAGHHLKYKRLKLTKHGSKMHAVMEVSGRKKLLNKFNEQVVELHFVQDVLLT